MKEVKQNFKENLHNFGEWISIDTSLETYNLNDDKVRGNSEKLFEHFKTVITELCEGVKKLMKLEIKGKQDELIMGDVKCLKKLVEFFDE